MVDVGDLDKAVERSSIFGGMNVTLNRRIERCSVMGIIDRLAVVVVHSRLSPVIGDKTATVDCQVIGLGLGTGIITMNAGRASIEHRKIEKGVISTAVTNSFPIWRWPRLYCV